MKIKFCLAVILLFLCSVQIVFAQEKIVSSGIINGKATKLPKPIYSQEAKDFCASGQVKVEVLIGEDGSVISAKAISGDELLQDSAIEAAKKAKFAQTADMQPIKVKGIVVYNFVPEKKCIVVGIVNKRAQNLPKPKIVDFEKSKQFQIKGEQIVAVQIVIDMSGKVLRAKAISGVSSMKAACENAARQAKFAPTLVDGGAPFNVKALLIYKFKTDGTIDTEVEKNDKSVVRTPIDLVKPLPLSCNCKFGIISSVFVQAKTDREGNVIEAKSLSGHPILRIPSEKAALESKFLPTNIESNIIIQYDFVETGKWSVETSNIQFREFRVNK